MPHIDNITQHMIYGPIMTIKIWIYDRKSRVIEVFTMMSTNMTKEFLSMIQNK